MSTLSSFQLIQLQTADNFWNKDADEWDHGNYSSFKSELEAISITQDYLKLHNVDKLDFKNNEHQNLLAIALKIDQISSLTIPKEAQTALEMKTIRSIAHDHVVQPLQTISKAADVVLDVAQIVAPIPVKLGIYLARYAITFDKPNPVTYDDINSAYPHGVPITELSKLLNMPLDQKANSFLMSLVINEIETRSNYAEEIKSNLYKQPNNEASFSPSSSSQDVSNNRTVPKQVEDTVKKEEKEYIAGAVHQFATNFAHLISTYNSLESAKRDHEKERNSLLKAFDSISDHLKLDLKIESFSHKNPSEIVDFFVRQNPSRNLALYAESILKITEKVKKDSNELKEKISSCLEKKATIELQAAKQRALNKLIRNYCEDKLTDLNNKGRFLATFGGALHVCNTIAPFLGPFSAPLSAATAAANCLLQIGTGSAKGRRDRALEKLNDLMEVSQKNAERLGYLSEKNLRELIALQKDKNDEIDCIIANRDFIEPNAYIGLLGEAKKWIEDTKAEKEKNVSKLKGICDTKRRQVEQLGEEFKKKKADHQSIILKIQGLEGEILENNREREGLEREITNNKEKLDDLSNEQELAAYIAPIANLNFSLKQAGERKFVDEKEKRLFEETQKLFNTSKKNHEEKHGQTTKIIDTLTPFANGFRFLAEECEWLKERNLGTLLGKSPELLELLKDANQIRINADAVKSFSFLFNQIKKDNNFSDTEAFNIIDPKIVISEMVIPALAIFGKVFHICQIIHQLRNPARDTTLQSISKMLEKTIEIQKDLLKSHLQILVSQNEQLSEQMRNSTKTILADIESGTTEILNRIDENRFYDFEVQITTLKNKIEREDDPKKLAEYYRQSNGQYLNGERVLEGYENNLRNITRRPEFYSGYLFKQIVNSNENIPNLVLLAALRGKIPEKVGVDKSYLELYKFPYQQLQKAMACKIALLQMFNSNFNDPTQVLNSGPKEFLLDTSKMVGMGKFHLNKVLHEQKFHLAKVEVKDNGTDGHGCADHIVLRESLDEFTLREVSSKVLSKFKITKYDNDITLYIVGDVERSFWAKCYHIPENDTIGSVRVLPYIIEEVDRKITNASKKVLLNLSLEIKVSRDLHNDGYYISNYPSLNPTTSSDSYLNVEDIKMIPSFFPRDSALYVSLLNKLLQNYFGWVADSEFSGSKHGNITPLTFPRELLESLYAEIKDLAYQIKSLQIGLIVLSSYDLIYNNKKDKYELVINFNLEYRDKSKKPILFCECLIAEFDSKTVDAFKTTTTQTFTETKKKFVAFKSKKETLSESDTISETNYSEFLLHAMYCGEHGLGLPGEGSYRIKSGELVAPVERSFPGLYPLFSAYPNTLKSYNSNNNKNTALVFSKDFVKNIDVTSYENDMNMNGRPFHIRYKEGYYLSCSDVILKSKEIRKMKEFINYQREYHLFLALNRLNYKFPEDKMKEFMYKHLGLTSPDNLPLLQSESEEMRDFLPKTQNFIQACIQENSKSE